jgi:hypothetical protein
MLFISVTRLRIRAIRFLPVFALHARRTRNQVCSASGFQGGSILVDKGRTFWTMTAWDSQGSMHQYMSTGAHGIVMPRLLDWCDEASLVHWLHPGAALPSWAEADQRMREGGRPSKLRRPSPVHATLNYRPPRLRGSRLIRLDPA